MTCTSNIISPAFKGFGVSTWQASDGLTHVKAAMASYDAGAEFFVANTTYAVDIGKAAHDACVDTIQCGLMLTGAGVGVAVDLGGWHRQPSSLATTCPCHCS
jgi:hypothetical protein